MPIDNCTHSFDSLSVTILPKYLADLNEAIKSPFKAAEIANFKSASNAALQAVGRKSDFSGCYVFIQHGKPIYVGISRKVVRRLVQHLNTDSHFTASLVYRMASKNYPHELKRDQAMLDDKFKASFLEQKESLRKMEVAFIEIDNDLELYVFEVFASMAYDTSAWNTFRTH